MTQNASSALGPNASLIGVSGSRAALHTPALVIDLDALERNIARMADHAKAHGLNLRPHAKTHKSLNVGRLQVQAGALGVSAATLGEAEILAGGGIAGVLLTTPVVGAAKLDRLVALNAKADGLMVVADNLDNVTSAAAAMKAAGQKLTMVTALDVGTHRIGAATVDDALAIARAIAAAPELDFAGIHAYAGNIQHIADFAERQEAAKGVKARVNELAMRLRAAGLEPRIVSGAGTGTFAIDATDPVFTELQVGSYVFTDAEYNACALTADEPVPFEPALRVQCMVVSVNQPGYAVTDGGTKRFAQNGPLPEILSGAPESAIYAYMGDEHGKVIFAEPDQSLPLGAKIECLTSHCDPTVNLYGVYHLVRGDTLVDIWPVDARGAF